MRLRATTYHSSFRSVETHQLIVGIQAAAVVHVVACKRVQHGLAHRGVPASNRDMAAMSRMPNQDSSTASASFLHTPYYGRTGDISSCRFLCSISTRYVRQKHSHKETDDQDGDDADALHILPEGFPLQLDRQLHGQRFLQSQ